MEVCVCVLTNEQASKLQDLSDFYGENKKDVLMKLALVKFHSSLFVEDREEYGEDQDLLAIQREKWRMRAR